MSLLNRYIQEDRLTCPCGCWIYDHYNKTSGRFVMQKRNIRKDNNHKCGWPLICENLQSIYIFTQMRTWTCNRWEWYNNNIITVIAIKTRDVDDTQDCNLIILLWENKDLILCRWMWMSLEHLKSVVEVLNIVQYCKWWF